jgi:hypothetical protein
MYSLSSVDPITRWKIKHNVPVGQHEASGIFGRLMQSRQIMGDPAIMDVTLQGKDPYEYSPKIRRAVDDLQKYLDEDETHKSVIYGNLVKSQIDAISKSLDKRDIPYSKFIGIGNDGSSVKQRIESLDKFRKGKNRVLLISGAGGEGLDLQGVGMMQLLEGHYNPEKIQQAEARVRRYQRTPSGDNMEPIMIKKYVSTIPTTGINKLMPKFLKSTPASVDEWIYTVAKRKDDLNEQFRNVVKTASIADSMTMTKDVPGIDEIVSNAAAEVAMNMQLGMVGQIGSAWGGAIANFLKPRQKQMTETAVRQRILDTEHPEFLQKKHVSRIMAKSLVDERRLETDIGTSLLGGATGIMAGNLARAVVKPASKVGKMAPWVAGLTVGMATQPAINHFINKALAVRIMRTDDVKKGVDKYVEELEKKMHRKYKASQEFINEYDKRKELGVDVYSI